MDPCTSGDETQMSDNDQTQMSENDVPPKNHGTSQIFHSRRKRIASDSDHDMGESSQQIGLDPDLTNAGQKCQESDSGSDSAEAVLFRKPVRKVIKSRQSSDVHGQESDSDSESESEVIKFKLKTKLKLKYKVEVKQN